MSHRLPAALLAACLTFSLSACSGIGTPKETAVPEQPAEVPPNEDPTTPPPSLKPGQTNPEKYDAALLQPADLAGWEAGDSLGEHSETKVDPEPCTALHHATVGKVASDMGATSAYAKDDLFFQEYLETVDKGSDSVAQVERLVGQCGQFTMVDADEKTPVKVAKFDAPGLGDKSVGVRLTIQAEAPVDLFVVLAGHKDVLMTTASQGEKPDQAMALDLAKKAMEKLKKNV